MSYYRYCADCEKGEITESLPEDVKEARLEKIGKPLFYKQCPVCKGNNMAYVSTSGYTNDSTGYWRSVIEYYYDDHEVTEV